MRSYALLIAILFASPQTFGQSWNCSSTQSPQECSGSVPDAYTATEHACLLKLYTCGRYLDLVQRIESTEKGLAREQSYFLGAGYFGLSQRTDAQSLKCFNLERSKNQLEEFILATQNDPKSEVSYGTDAQMDMLYQATRTFELLKKEPGCAESSHSEGSLYRLGRLYANARMNGLMMDTDDAKNDGAAVATKNGFKAMRDTLNVFVTEASKLESRFSLYSSQIDSSTQQLQKVSLFLQNEALNSSIVSVTQAEGGGIKVSLDQTNLKTFLDGIQEELESKGVSILAGYESKFQAYANKNNKYYDTLREDNLKAIDLLLSRIATNINTFKNSGEGAKALRAADDQPEGKLVSLTRMAQVWAKYKPKAKAKCSSPFGPKWWYCN